MDENIAVSGRAVKDEKRIATCVFSPKNFRIRLRVKEKKNNSRHTQMYSATSSIPSRGDTHTRAGAVWYSLPRGTEDDARLRSVSRAKMRVLVVHVERGFSQPLIFLLLFFSYFVKISFQQMFRV